MTQSQAQVDAALLTIRAVADAIRDITLANENGLRGVPSGHLWARLDGKMTFETYNSIIGILKRARLITEKNHLLSWVAEEEIMTRGGFMPLSKTEIR